jgi:23S rRNA (uracil1939-C5)-methyltransferase
MTRERKDLRLDRLVELSVERIGAQGDGIAYHDGEPVFLPFTAPGDRVRVEIGVKRGGGNEGRVVEWLSLGPRRADPPCRHFGTCGGCALQHVEPAYYRGAKLATLSAALERVGIDPQVVEPLRTVPPARRRANIGLARPRDPRLPPRVGFRRRFRHELVDITQCLVLEPLLFSVATELRHIIRNLLPLGATAQAAMTATDSGVDLLIEAVEPPALGALQALAEFAEARDLPRIVWRTAGNEFPVVMRRPVRVALGGVPVPFPPGGFQQASREAEQVLVEAVLAGVGSREPTLDLFAGLGTFTLSLARNGAVHAVEGDPHAVAALAAAASGRGHISVERRDLARDPVPPEDLSHYAAAVFDPPRAGALRQAQALAASRLDTVIGVSCNPATFARDAAQLIAGGLRLERLTPVDQFVWTAHLELVGVFRR